MSQFVYTPREALREITLQPRHIIKQMAERLCWRDARGNQLTLLDAQIIGTQYRGEIAAFSTYVNNLNR